MSLCCSLMINYDYKISFMGKWFNETSRKSLITEFLKSKQIIIYSKKFWSLAIVNCINRYINKKKFLYSWNKPH